MNFYKTTAAFGATACLLMASTALGTEVERQSFEGTLVPGTEWLASGNDAEQVTFDQSIAAPTPAGFPTAAASSAKALAIAGSATRTYGVSGNTVVDMMVKVSIPEDQLGELATGTGEEAEGAKFAVAVDSDGKFKYYNPNANPKWVEISAAYADEAWVRVTMKFDYASETKTCTVALDGNTRGTYPLIASATALASIQVKGSTEIDEVLVAQNEVPAFSGNDVIAEGAAATKKWLTANDITWPTNPSAADITKLDTQYKLGLDPKTDVVTLPLSFEQDSSDDKATLSFPGMGAYGGTGSYVLQTSSDNSAWSDSKAVAAGANGVTTTTVSLPSTAGQAVYYRILASSTPAQ